MSAGVLGDDLGKVLRTGRYRSHGCGAVASIRVLLAQDDLPSPACQVERGMEQTDSPAADDDNSLPGVYPAMTAMSVKNTGERFRQGQPRSWYLRSYRDDVAARDRLGWHTQPRREATIKAVTDELAVAT